MIFIMNLCVLDVFKFASRMLQIAQILVLTFNIFRGSMPHRSPKTFPPFFSFSFFLCVSQRKPLAGGFTNKSGFHPLASSHLQLEFHLPPGLKFPLNVLLTCLVQILQPASSTPRGSQFSIVVYSRVVG